MITGVYATFAGSQPDELRPFLRDRLGLESVPLGDSWLLVPMQGEAQFTRAESSRQEISLWCDDIHLTVRDLKSRGVQFTQPIEDWGFGLGTFIAAPGDITIQLCERYA